MVASHQISFLIGAALAGGFVSSFYKASNTISELQKKMSTLSKNQGQINAFGKLQERLNQTGGAFNAAQQRVRELGTKMRTTVNPSEQLKRQFTSAHMEANKLQGKLMAQRKELGQLRSSLSAAGVDTKNFSNEQMRLAQNTKLAAEAAKMQQANERLQKAQGNLAASKQRLSWGNMKSELLTSAGIVLALKAPIQQAANFEQAMARVGAVSGATGKDFDTLSTQSRQLGRDTQFTAVQAANSQEMLARAGFKTQEIIDTMPALLDMAAAEGMDLANGADIMSSVLRGYQLAADQSTRVADVLAKTSASSNTSISTLGESMKMVGPIAAGLNVPFEETAAMIGVMGDAGIKGTMAGTALRAALIRLSKEPKMTAEALEELGISTRDSAGNLRTMPSLMQALSKKMANMGEADQMEKLSKIFGTEAASGMLAIMNAVKSGKLEELTGKIENAEGAAKSMAERMNATAQGAMKRLGSASESLMIDIGNVLLPTFTGGVELLARFTGALSAFAQEFPMVTKLLVGGVAALGAYKVASTATSIAWTVVKLPLQHASVFMAKLNAWMVLGGHASIWAMAKAKIHAMAEKMRNRVLKLGTIIQKAWNAAMQFGSKLLDAGKLIAQKGAQIALNAATKTGTAIRYGWNAALRAGVWLLDTGKLVLYHVKQVAIAAATKLWTAAIWLWNSAMSLGRGLLNVGQLVLYHAKQIAIAVATKAWTAAQWLWNAAMNANPIGLIITGIAGLVAAGYWLYNNWDSVCQNISDAWNWVRDNLKDFWEWITGVFSWDNLISGLTGAVEWVVNLITAPFKAAYDLIAGWFGSFFSSNSAKLDADIAKLNNVPNVSLDRGGATNLSYTPEGVPILNPIPSSATGGIFNTPQVRLFAESGAEAVIPLTDRSRGIPLWKAAGEAMGMSYGSGATTNNNMSAFSPNINITVNGGDADVARRVADEVRRVLRDIQEYNDRTQLA